MIVYVYALVLAYVFVLVYALVLGVRMRRLAVENDRLRQNVERLSVEMARRWVQELVPGATVELQDVQRPDGTYIHVPGTSRN